MNAENHIPFRAALFDLDGTLLDSQHIWRRVDAQFFAARGIPEPEDYARTIQGMSFRECAEYTVKRFGLIESCESVMEEWTRRTIREYRRVAMKPGAREYLRMLKRAGVKLAVASANKPEVFGPALEAAGVLDLFDAICTTADVGDRGKGDGALFLFAAQRLGADPADCVVFEDVLEGIAGARRAGMRAYCVRDVGAAYHFDRIAGLAEGMIDDFGEMRRYHAFPDNARRCVIFTARCEGDPSTAYRPLSNDYVLCADAGWRVARSMGIKPDEVIGDFDSSQAPAGENVARFPVEKDDTDTMLCLKRGLALGFDDFLIVGGFGGRVDHTVANLQTLHYAALRGARVQMRDGRRWAAAVAGGAIQAPRLGDKFSVFALSDECRGVCIRGAKYALEDGVLTNAFPLGVSNEFAAEVAEISVAEGALLVVADEDRAE